jgi:FkbM family methyltransferase
MVRRPFKVMVDFAAGGNSTSFVLGGWSRPERDYSFNWGHEARLAVPKPYDADSYELSIDVWPFVVPDRLPVQQVEIIVRGMRVMHAIADSRLRRVMTCEIPPHIVAGCESVDITFRFPDAVAPNSVLPNSLDLRIMAFAFFKLCLVGRMTDQLAIDPMETTMPDPVESQQADERLCLVDVGAMGGVQPKWRPHLDRITPVLFEPNPDEAAKLRAQHPHMVVVEAALGNIVGRRNLIITENPTCISLRLPNQEFLADYGIRPHVRVIGAREVTCTRYDVLHQAGAAPAPDAIKLDVQGCEFEVLLGFGALLQNCVGIELETHLYPVYREQKLLHDIIALLRDYGFVLRKLDQNKMDNFDGDLVEVDAFFTKQRKVVRSYDAMRRRKFDLLTEVWQLSHYRL